MTSAPAEFRALEPDLVVVALCGFDVSRARGEFAAVTDRDAPVLFTRRVAFLPGAAAVDAAEQLASLIRR